jgi:hypothetical protein
MKVAVMTSLLAERDVDVDAGHIRYSKRAFCEPFF